jgi:hypothetical protein
MCGLFPDLKTQHACHRRDSGLERPSATSGHRCFKPCGFFRNDAEEHTQQFPGTSSGRSTLNRTYSFCDSWTPTGCSGRANISKSFYETVWIGSDEVTVITAPAPELRAFAALHGADSKAFLWIVYLCRPEDDCAVRQRECERRHPEIRTKT